MGKRRRPSWSLLAGLPVLLLGAALSAVGGRSGPSSTTAAAAEPPPAPPKVVHAYHGSIDGLTLENLQGLDDRQKAAARAAIDAARKRLEPACCVGSR